MAYRYKVATIFLIGFFIDCVNIFMSAIALPNIAQEMAISPTLVTWVTNSYILGLTLIIPISTWLAQRFGTRFLLCFSMLLFAVAVGMCGQTSSFSQLIGWRFIQGIGGGLLIPVGQALTFSQFQGVQRSKISTLIMAVALIAPALSPTIGGAIVDHFSWRWVFFSNIPFALIAAGLAWWWIREPKVKPDQLPDLKGLLLISLGLASLLISLSLYQQKISTAIVLASFLIAALFIGLYYRHYRRCSHAIVDLSLLKNPNLRISVLIYYAVPGVFSGVNILNIFYLQQELLFSAEITGRFMILYAMGAFASMVLGGRLYNQIGAKKLFTSGVILHNAGIVLLLLVNSRQDLVFLIVAYCLMGIGGGLCANTAQTTALIDFKGIEISKGSVIWNINRQVAFSIGVAVFSMLLGILLSYQNVKAAYHFTFLIGATLGLLSLFAIKQLISHGVKVYAKHY